MVQEFASRRSPSAYMNMFEGARATESCDAGSHTVLGQQQQQQRQQLARGSSGGEMHFPSRWPVQVCRRFRLTCRLLPALPAPKVTPVAMLRSCDRLPPCYEPGAIVARPVCSASLQNTVPRNSLDSHRPHQDPMFPRQSLDMLRPTSEAYAARLSLDVNSLHGSDFAASWQQVRSVKAS